MTPRARMRFGLAAAALAAAACGGASATTAPVLEGSAAPCAACFSDRWEQPPPGIGQTPPEQIAPLEVIADFVGPEGSGEGSGTSP